MSPQVKLKRAREKRGISIAELSARCGISLPRLRDAEAHKDEIITAMTLKELRAIGDVISIDLVSLFTEERVPHFSYNYLRETLRRHLLQMHIPLEAFESKIGWELDDFMANPKAAENWNVDCLIDVCDALSLQWECFL